MECKEILSIITLSLMVLLIPITSFADHSEITIVPVIGSGVPGCETTVNGCFLPSTATVDVGGVVIFSNTDTLAHTFTSGVSGYFGEEEPLGFDGEFDSGLLIAGNSFSHTFNSKGIYNYFCIVHPWMTGVVNVSGVSTAEQLDYKIIGGSVLDVVTDNNANSLIFTIHSTSDGQLTVTIPRQLLDAMTGDETGDFFVLLDGQMVAYDETTSSTARTLYVAFPHGIQSIEIIGTTLGSSPTPPLAVNISVSTNKSTYYENDVIEISGRVSEILSGFSISLQITQPDGEIVDMMQTVVFQDKTFSEISRVGGPLYEISGVYTIRANYGTESVMASTTFEYAELRDTIPPLLILPQDMLVDATSPDGVQVEYTVKAIDDVDGIVESFCNPSTGYVFPVGSNVITCRASDGAGNAIVKAFMITVQTTNSGAIIPDWIKDVAGFWCNDEIDDSGFVEAVQYLIENGVIVISLAESEYFSTQIVPDWVKNNACWWKQGLISDDDFASGLEYLVQQGIIKV